MVLLFVLLARERARDMNDMYDWECELCRTDGRPEVITRSEFDRIVDECDTVPLYVIIVEDENM